MKILKDGTIEACCGDASEWINYFSFEQGTLWILDSFGYHLFNQVSVNYCPFCGAKTVVEE